MGPAAATKKVEVLEEHWATIDSTIRSAVTEEVAAALKGAVSAMEQNLANRFITTVEETFRRQEKQLEEVTCRLEGRISRTREANESMIGMIKNDQMKFQLEVRSALNDLRSVNKVIGKQQEVSPQHSGIIPFGRNGNPNFGEGSGASNGHLFREESPIGKGSGGGPGGGYGNGVYGGGGTNWRHKKLDLPLFDGTNPDGWILRAERYFSFYRLNEEEKIEATVVALEGQALLWFQWEHRRRPIKRWDQAKALLRRQFRSHTAGTLQEQWLANIQEGTVIEYRLKFIELLAPLENVPEEIALGQFVIGLREDIRAEVRLLGPISVDHAMELAIMVEDKL